MALDQLASMLNANPAMQIEIVGHSDNDETSEGRINPRFAEAGQKRADQVSRYLTSMGVSAGQLKVSSRENTDPASTKDSDLSRAKNRRVTFQIL
jgi:outer membrane protein OmpA-like peptidoglycan-associated protein